MLVESLLYSSGVEDVGLFDALINPFERNAHTHAPYTCTCTRTTTESWTDDSSGRKGIRNLGPCNVHFVGKDWKWKEWNYLREICPKCFYRFRDYVCHPILQEEPITKNRIMQDDVSSIIARHLVHILKDEMKWNSEMRLCEETLSAHAHSDYSSNLSPPFPVLSAIKLGSELLHNLIVENENHRHLHHQFSETIFSIALRLLSRPSSFFSRSYSKGSRQQTVIRVEGNQQQQKQEEMDIFSIHKSIVGSLLPKCLRFDALTREVHPTSKDKERSVFIKRLEVNSSR